MGQVEVNTSGIVRLFKKALWAARTPRELRRLGGDSNPLARVIAEAIGRVKSKDLADEQRVWIEKIEKAREEMLKDQSILGRNFEDVGAGSHLVNGMEQTVAEVCMASSRPALAQLLFQMIHDVEPGHVLELGTCLGISAAYQAAALQLSGQGELTTIEGDDARAKKAKDLLEGLGLRNAEVVTGLIQDALPDVLNQASHFQFAFIDGHHDGPATIDYVNQILPQMPDASILVLDDISWSQGMQEAWNTVKGNARVEVAIDMYMVGICVLSGEQRARRDYEIMFW